MKNDSWDSLENAVDKGPVSGAWKIAGIVVVIGLICVGSCHFLNYANDAVSTVSNELAPSVLLQKYMWLKEAHAQLDHKKADIEVYQHSLEDLNVQYADVPRRQWARVDLDTWAQKSEELAGIKSSYNDLAAQYNAKMAEVNWSFTNVGMLPQGATEPLPRNYAPYVGN